MSWLSLIPRTWLVKGGVWLAVVSAIATAVTLHLASDTREREIAFDAGRQSAFNEAKPSRFDSVLMGMAYRARELAMAKTDTVEKIVTKRIHTVDTLIDSVPTYIRDSVSAVDTALKACSALARDCSEFRARALEEREAARVRIVNDSVLIHGLAVSRVALRDTLAQLAKRPTRKAQFVTAIISLSVGALACKAARC